MTRYGTWFVVIFFTTLFSCRSSSTTVEPVVQPGEILKDLRSFLVYRQNHLRLAEDFKALDESSAAISKEAFFQRLTSGQYLPLRLRSKDSVTSYQLYKMGAGTDTGITQTLTQWGEHLLGYYQREGKELPPFSFADMNGNVYDNQNTKGKILVLKCWFIGCLPCVKEMPALNEMKKRYAGRHDILFVSVAPDAKEDLKNFLKRTTFDYEVVPNQKKFLAEDLVIDTYPTHILINKKGFITKVVNDQEELAVALNTEAAK
jgi:thiol-disulfide isomerase/thioredoxin